MSDKEKLAKTILELVATVVLKIKIELENGRIDVVGDTGGVVERFNDFIESTEKYLNKNIIEVKGNVETYASETIMAIKSAEDLLERYGDTGQIETFIDKLILIRLTFENLMKKSV